MPLPSRLEKDFKSEAKYYTYKELAYLVAWASVASVLKKEMTPDEYIDLYPELWEKRLIEADQLISHTPFKELDF